MLGDFDSIPLAYRKWKLSDFPSVDQERLKERNIFLSGPNGCGKSCCAAAIAKHLATLKYQESTEIIESMKWPSFKWVLVPKLLIRLRSSFQREGRTEEEIINEMVNLAILVLDDFGAEKQSDFAVTSLYVIIASRMEWGRCTILTTNLGLREIDAAEPRIASRLASWLLIGKEYLGNVDRRVRSKK